MTGVRANLFAASPAFQLTSVQESRPVKEHFFGYLKRASSGQRIVDYEVMEKPEYSKLSDKDYEILLKIVQAEAGSEDEKGKMLVAGVVMNRVESNKFPDTVEEVVFQNENGVYQFSPVANGTYQSAVATEETRRAVDRVLEGEVPNGKGLKFGISGLDPALIFVEELRKTGGHFVTVPTA